MNRLSPVSLLVACLMSVVALMPCSARAWAHWTAMDNEEYKHKLLIYAVLQKQHFNYCLIDQTTLMDRDSIKIQVDHAIQVWSRAFAAVGVKGLHADLVSSCGAADLQIVIGINQYKALALQESYAFVTPVKDLTAPLYMHLNVSDKPKVTPYGDDVNLRIIDIKDALNLTLATLGGFLDQMSYGGYTVNHLIHDHPDLAEYTHYLHLSYGIILHEFGHTFGLADTYEGGIQVSGSTQWRSPGQPSSLMQAVPYYNLQTDDLKGLTTLVKRVRAELVSTTKGPR